jgi:predicted ester cyclase
MGWQTSGEEASMSAEQNKALVRSWLEAVDSGDVSVVEKFLDPDYVDHNPPPFPGMPPGLEGARRAFIHGLDAFSGFHHEIEEQYADGETVITRLVGYGKHTGDFLGIPPTGKDVRMEGIAIHRIVERKLVEHWAQIDAVGLLVQLGAIPPPGTAAP